MSTRTLHPALDVGEVMDLREVNGISNLDDVRLIQACCEAVELDVLWKLTWNGQQAVLVEIPTPDQLRARDERLIDAAYEWAANEWGSVPHRANTDVAAIIAAAEAES